MIRVRCSVVIFCFCPLLGWGQGDTTYLQEVEVTGKIWSEYLAGTKTFSLDSTLRSQSFGKNIGEVLEENTAIHIKSYGGFGQLSTIAFRGSGASHTTVLWNGLPIQSSNLGQADLSLLNLSGLDQISWQHGAASALYGSGAIGGTIQINSEPQWGQGLSVKLDQGVGSYGRYYGGIHLHHGGDRIEISSKGYYQKAENNFEVDQLGHTYGQNNAAISSYGFTQRFGYKISQRRWLFAEAWYQSNDRELQPVIGDINNEDQLYDKQLRTVLEYSHGYGQGLLNFTTGYLYDFQSYNNQSGPTTHQWIANLDYHRDLKTGLDLRIGGQWRNIRSDVPQYKGQVKEISGAAFGSLSYRRARWHMALNARQSWVQGYSVPFTPSLGADITLTRWQHSQLRGKLLLSKSYRVPSLNDRYWQPGGNPLLLPEDGLGAEATMAFELLKGTDLFTASATYYHNKVSNWIIWIPGGQDENIENSSYWYPENIREVKSRGAEVHWQWKLKIWDWDLDTGGNYSYTRATNERTIDRFDRSRGKQLPFVPYHRANWRINLINGKWSGLLKVYYTGKRYIETNNESPALPSYTLVDLGVSKRFILLSSDVNLTAGLNNIFDLSYQSMSLRAMPGRNYQLSISIQFEEKKKHDKK